MGQTLMGGTQQTGNVNLLNPQQTQFHQQLLSQLGPQANDFLMSLLQGTSPEQLQDLFQTAYVDPAMQVFNRQIVPSIQQRYSDANASSSSALNQALAQSASDLSTSLGSQYGQLYQNNIGNQLNALNQISPYSTGQTQVPILQQRQGILGPLLQGAGSAAAAAGPMMLAASSREVKENIKDYDKGIDYLREFKVKNYDYKEEVGGTKNRVGLIAEELPEELTLEKDGILCVDLYGLMGVMINAMQELEERLEKLEEK